MASIDVAEREFELTEQSLSDDNEIRKAIILDVPNGFVENFVLKKHGEFCISKALDGDFYLSIFVEYNKSTKQEAHVIHLRIKAEDDKMQIEGMLFARAKSLGALIYNLANNNTVEILAGVLEKDVKMEHLVGISAAEINDVYVKKTVADKNILAQTYNMIIYSGRMEFADGKTHEAIFEETRKYESKEDFLTKFFDQLVTGAQFTSNKLPIRLPIGAILQPPTLIYSQKLMDVGFSLDYVLKYHDHQLDLTQRIKLCSSAVRIMSELHHADVFHGAVKPENFYAEYVGAKNDIKQYELMFNGASGLLFHDQSDNTINMVDYDLIAPELSFTRKLTKESGVFNMGRLFEQILKTEILKTYTMKPEEEPRALHDMRQLIQRATRPNPQHRPTMAGVVMMIREVLLALPSTTAPINFVHFDQFE